MRVRLAALAALALWRPLAAEEALTDTRAFERAQADSFWRFDACGDSVTGQMYRQALADKFAACPFADAARARFKERSQAQERKSAEMLRRLIDEHGGLPMRLDGMTRTCREQIASPEYQELRGLLEREASGRATSGAVFPAGCDGVDG